MRRRVFARRFAEDAATCKGCSNLSPVQHLAVPHKPATAERD
jgi:hypothetical protein